MRRQATFTVEFPIGRTPVLDDYFAARCERCTEIRATPALDLLYFFNPNREWTEEDGENVRAMALEEHAKWGHPTEADFHSNERAKP